MFEKQECLTCAQSGNKPMNAGYNGLGIRLLLYNLKKQIE